MVEKYTFVQLSLGLPSTETGLVFQFEFLHEGVHFLYTVAISISQNMEHRRVIGTLGY